MTPLVSLWRKKFCQLSDSLAVMCTFGRPQLSLGRTAPQVEDTCVLNNGLYDLKNGLYDLFLICYFGLRVVREQQEPTDSTLETCRAYQYYTAHAEKNTAVPTQRRP